MEIKENYERNGTSEAEKVKRNNSSDWIQFQLPSPPRKTDKINQLIYFIVFKTKTVLSTTEQ